jgi:curved DNA-binding protein CbpA
LEPKQVARTPSLVEGVDMKTLPIGPEEAFVLTRVDGRSNEADISAATGLASDRVAQSLQRLVELGAVRFGDAVEQPPPPRQHPSVPPGPKITHPAIETTAPDSSRQPAQALYDPGELDEVVDIELPRKRKILDYFYRLDSASHYELLGVTEDADKKVIRDAYFKQVGTFHPDRYFGKSLGSFKAKMEKVFQRMTEAQETLSRKGSRDEYDAYLKSVRRTRSIEAAMDDVDQNQAEIAEARRQIESEARVAERISHAPATWSQPPTDPEERKRALARKLRGSLAPPSRESGRPSQPNRAALQEQVADELKRRYEARLSQAKQKQTEKYVQAADEAIATKDLVSAANALRIAVSLAPEDEALKQRFEEVQEQATTALSGTYLEQAKYEESNKRWDEAAASYEKAARGKPSAQIFDRAAFCLLEAGSDLRKAGDLARKAVSLAPKSVEPRVTLARVYLGAGMKESALGEFERASQLAPDDDTIKDWIKRIKRGEV